MNERNELEGERRAVADYALSLKQPWAALLVHGCKTIEIRRWPTARRGRVLIHASRVPDERPEAWAHVPPALREAALLSGGIIGVGDLTDCVAYPSPESFQIDRGHHLNPPSWFRPPVLYGFTFSNLQALPFRQYPGWMRFFPIEDRGSARRASQLLVSVRTAAEAEKAVSAGAALIDVKEPARGSLGCAEDDLIREVVDAVAGRRPVSAARGEMLETFWNEIPAIEQLDYVKWGLAGFRLHAPLLWRAELADAAQRLAERNPRCRMVAVAYADWERAQSPAPHEVCALAAELSCGAFLVDTWKKDGSTLLDWLAVPEVHRLCENSRTAGVPVALAGSLGVPEIRRLKATNPDWFAVRGAVCTGGKREAALDEGKIRRLVELLGGSVSSPRSES